jgi:hypothetical protein
MTGIKEIDDVKVEKAGNFDLMEKKNPQKF